MKTRSIIIPVCALLLIISGCKKNDHYQVYEVKYLDSSTGSAKNVAIGANPDDSIIHDLKSANGQF